MDKNNLRELIKERGITNKQLEEGTGLSRQTISMIKNNEFHAMHLTTITKLLNYFNILFDDLITITSDQEYLFHMLNQKEFNETHIAYLEELLSENLKMSFKYHPYSSNQCLNFYSKGYYKKVTFSGNIRINTSNHCLTFEIIDFDFHKKVRFILLKSSIDYT